MLSTPLTLSNLFQEYLSYLPDGTVESNSLYTAKIHIAHFERVLGKTFAVRSLSLNDLQGYVQQRGKERGRRNGKISPITMRKELSTFSGVWSWARPTASHLLRNSGLPGCKLRLRGCSSAKTFSILCHPNFCSSVRSRTTGGLAGGNVRCRVRDTVARGPSTARLSRRDPRRCGHLERFHLRCSCIRSAGSSFGTRIP